MVTPKKGEGERKWKHEEGARREDAKTRLGPKASLESVSLVPETGPVPLLCVLSALRVGLDNSKGRDQWLLDRRAHALGVERGGRRSFRRVGRRMGLAPPETLLFVGVDGLRGLAPQPPPVPKIQMSTVQLSGSGRQLGPFARPHGEGASGHVGHGVATRRPSIRSRFHGDNCSTLIVRGREMWGCKTRHASIIYCTTVPVARIIYCTSVPGRHNLLYLSSVANFGGGCVAGQMRPDE